ncbi:MAG TPA: serine/threonine-protein kinase [Polyangia bacterium]|jgi:serine/threonine-protein kinase|nr:serine/threonine-protein kinase [Polyangia bacterium]
MAESQDIIDYLVAHGAYVEAARLCVERNELARAIRLYERVWQFGDAIPIALRLGDRPLGVRLSLDAGLPDRAAEIAAAIPDDARAELRAAADAFASRGRHFEAARTAERGLDLPRAAALYRRANAILDTARVLELTGDHHEAGVLYERLAAQGAEDEAAAARLALGRLLGRLGRHEQAVRLLQLAVRDPVHRHAAGRALCVELLALGLRVAATEVLSRLRREAPELPPSPEAFAAMEGNSPTGPGAAVVDVGLLRRRFRIVKPLGGGATGRVYLAEDTLLGRAVAVKLLAVGAGAKGAERQAYLRFAREAEAAGRLRHPNIVTLFDLDEAQGLFVLEFMAGGTLAERLAERGPLSAAAARRLALDLLAALGTAHERGIVHRDVKPANIFFDAAGNAKLGDFGAAFLIDFGQTQTGGLIGTVAYMAPEQISGASIGPEADLYALGVTLFEALTGRAPFLGPDIVAQHLAEAPPDVVAVRPGLAPAHDEVLRRAMAKVPDQRFSSAHEMAEAIAAWPLEMTAVAEGANQQESSLNATPAPVAVPPSDDAESVRHEIGRTPEAQLCVTIDPHVGRRILLEVRFEPLSDVALARVRALAAAGGPHVQRILAVSPDRGTVTYEWLDGTPRTFGDLPGADRATLEEALGALAAEGLSAATARAIQTDGGPVLLIAPELE